MTAKDEAVKDAVVRPKIYTKELDANDKPVYVFRLDEKSFMDLMDLIYNCLMYYTMIRAGMAIAKRGS